MAEVSRILQSTLIPSFHSHPKTHTFQSHLPSFKRHPVQCSISTTESTTKATVSQKIPWGCDIDSLENASALQKWLTDSGLPPQKMGIQKVDVGERGLVALKNIRKGEKLLFVPPSLFITADSVRFFANKTPRKLISLMSFWLQETCGFWNARNGHVGRLVRWWRKTLYQTGHY